MTDTEKLQSKLDCRALAEYCRTNGASFQPGEYVDEQD